MLGGLNYIDNRAATAQSSLGRFHYTPVKRPRRSRRSEYRWQGHGRGLRNRLSRISLRAVSAGYAAPTDSHERSRSSTQAWWALRSRRAGSACATVFVSSSRAKLAWDRGTTADRVRWCQLPGCLASRRMKCSRRSQQSARPQDRELTTDSGHINHLGLTPCRVVRDSNAPAWLQPLVDDLSDFALDDIPRVGMSGCSRCARGTWLRRRPMWF